MVRGVGVRVFSGRAPHSEHIHQPPCKTLTTRDRDGEGERGIIVNFQVFYCLIMAMSHNSLGRKDEGCLTTHSALYLPWIQHVNQIFHFPPHIVLSVEDGRREKRETAACVAAWCIGKRHFGAAVYLDKFNVGLPVAKGPQPSEPITLF